MAVDWSYCTIAAAPVAISTLWIKFHLSGSVISRQKDWPTHGHIWGGHTVVTLLNVLTTTFLATFLFAVPVLDRSDTRGSFWAHTYVT
eukprot:scaffold2561_cov72-Skeletonema_dohrnii-CCMP3373.AAC.2